MYLWIKALHIAAVIAWMAALLYLPRLMVYHCAAEPGSQQSETFKLMEQRLLNIIATPAMLVVWGAGLWLLFEGGFLRFGWMHGKLLLVLALSMLHGLNAKWVKDFARDRNRHSARFYRIANEIPAVLMLGIVALAVVKPF